MIDRLRKKLMGLMETKVERSNRQALEAYKVRMYLEHQIKMDEQADKRNPSKMLEKILAGRCKNHVEYTRLARRLDNYTKERNLAIIVVTQEAIEDNKVHPL